MLLNNHTSFLVKETNLPPPPAEPGRLRREGWLAMKYLGIIPIDALRQTIPLVADCC
jgi:hypothetical protein